MVSGSAALQPRLARIFAAAEIYVMEGYGLTETSPVIAVNDYRNRHFKVGTVGKVIQNVEVKIAADGDLLAYNRAGHPTDAVTNTVKALLAWRSKFAADLSDSAMRRDLKREKTQELEETETYKAIRRTYQRATGKAPAYARMPEVTISSPKMKQDRSTSWYARNVNIRYQACLKRLKPRPPTS